MQDLIRHLPVVIYEYAFSPNGEQWFTYVSERALPVLGLSAEALMSDGRLLNSLCIPEDADRLQKAFTRGGDPGVQQRTGVRIKVNGQLKWLQFVYSDTLSADSVVRRSGIIQETAPDNDAGEAGASEYESLLEKLPIGVIIHHEGIVTYANTHAHFIIGATSPGQLIGLNTSNFVPSEYELGIVARIKKVATGESVPMVEERFIRLDGRIIDVETIAFPFFYKGHRSVQVIFCDNTEKKETEAQVRKNETLFSQLFQSLPIAVVMLDEMGKVSGANRGFVQMFGYNEDELKGRNLNDYIVPEDLRSEGIDLNNLIASNQVVSMESIRKHRSGKTINVILYGVPVVQDNQVIGIYGVYVDITDRKKVEEELKVRNAELDNFVYKVSHDLRAPLSSVLGLVNLSKLQGNDDNPLEYMDLIGEKIQALDHFIGDVLSHSKNLKMELDICQVDFRKIIEQTFIDLGYLAGARQMKRSLKIEGTDFYSDPWRVAEILRNLISNAIKYRRTREVESEISIKIHIDQLCADIVFTDNGIGIKEANLKRIFEMFYRATDQGDGSGIGLYIVKNAVEKLGGQIKVASSPGEGTRFHILLPNRVNSIFEASANG